MNLVFHISEDGSEIKIGSWSKSSTVAEQNNFNYPTLSEVRQNHNCKIIVLTLNVLLISHLVTFLLSLGEVP